MKLFLSNFDHITGSLAMASNEDEEGCVTLTWEIQNFSLLLSLDEERSCFTPFWKTEHPGKSVWWRLSIFAIDSNIYASLIPAASSLYLHRCEISIISSGREVPLKHCRRIEGCWCYYIKRNAVFGEKRQSILPNDTLTLRYKMWEKTMMVQEFRINTVLQRFSYLWNIENFRPDNSYCEYMQQENFLFKAYIKSEKGSHKFIFGEVSSKESEVLPMNCKLSVKTGTVNVIKELCDYSYNSRIYEIEIHHNTTKLDLQIESIIAVQRGCPDQLKLDSSPRYENVSKAVPGALGDDFLLIYKDKLFSDALLNAEDKSFPVHSSILSARSPVFRAMFEKDEMSEGRERVVDIDDVDSETVDRMLVYLYSDSLESVQQWEDASALYYAADKYDIKPLKHKCGRVLKEGLTVDNACEALVLADRHSDDQLLKSTVDFVHKNKEVISSGKWDSLQNSNPQLAAKILREICVK